MKNLTDNIIAIELPDDAPTDKELYFFPAVYSRLQYYKKQGDYYCEAVYEYITESRLWKENHFGSGEAEIVGITPLTEGQWVKVVDKIERYFPETYHCFRNYLKPFEWDNVKQSHDQRWSDPFATATESGLSLLQSQGLDLNKRYAIIKLLTPINNR